MSKSSVKKLLGSMDKSEIIAMVMEMYDARKEAKEYLEFYDSVEGNFEKTVQFISKNNLWDIYETRIIQCLRWASPCGWGFPDALNDLYEEAKAMKTTRK